jgi:DNA-binding CsgD family transcriptional regulator
MMGSELVKWVKSHKIDAHIITFVAKMPYIDSIKLLEAGAKGCVWKTSHPAKLNRAIDSISNGYTYFDSVHMDCEKISSRYSSDNQLTNRESEILQLIADGKTNKEIANFLQLSRKTVETHRLNIMKKLDVHSGIELIDAKNLFLIASNHLPVDELHNTSQFIIDNILQTVHKPERSVRLAKQDQGYKNHYLSDEMLAGKKELYDFTPESIYRAMTIFDRLQNKSDIQTLKTECYCLLAECHMSLALHGKSELELAAQKALELLDYVSDITTVDGKIKIVVSDQQPFIFTGIADK